MKKLIKLFTFFALLGLLFVGCQSAEDITSPAGDLERKPGFSWGTPPIAVNTVAGATTEIDLVAGQNQVVGSVQVEVSGSNLLISYHTDGGWYITETHLQVVAQPNQFFVNNAGNPKIGNFPYGGDNLNSNTAGPYVVPIPSGTTNGMVYIGAHAVVCTEGSGSGTSASICPPLLVNNATLLNFSIDNPDYYKTFYFDIPIIDTMSVFDGWCVDATRDIGFNPQINMNFLCSYNLGDLACVIEKPEFLNQVNWLINNRGSFSKFQIQGAIWKLLSDSDAWMTAEPDYAASDYMAAYNAAMSNGAGFIPACGEKVLIIMYDQAFPGSDVCSRISLQVLGFEVEVPCEQEQVCETAWAFNYPVDGTSKLFPGHVWFRYFGYKAL